MASSLSEKLAKLKADLLALTYYRQRQDKLRAEMNLTDATYEGQRCRVMAELQQAKDRIERSPIEDSVAKLRDQIAVDLVPLEDLMRSDNLSGGDFLREAYATIHKSTDPEDFAKLTTQLKIIQERAKVKSRAKAEKEKPQGQAPPPVKPPEKLTSNTAGEQDGGAASKRTDKGKEKQTKVCQPEHSITLKVAVAEFKVSRSALMRAIGDETLTSYRPPDAAKTAQHVLDAVEIARRWPRRK